MSILKAYDMVLDIFKDYYQYEEIKGYRREKVERISHTVFKDALTLAIIYKAWNINEAIKLYMFDDKI